MIPIDAVNWLEVALFLEKGDLESGVYMDAGERLPDGLGGWTYASTATMRLVGAGRENESRNAPRAVSLLRWLRRLGGYHLSLRAMGAEAFRDLVVGVVASEVRFVNFSTSARIDRCVLKLFSWDSALESSQDIAVANGSDPRTASAWGFGTDPQSRGYRSAYEGGTFHPENYPVCVMVGEASRYAVGPPV